MAALGTETETNTDHSVAGVPAETKIYYSKQKTARAMRVVLIFFIVGILLPVFFHTKSWAYFFGVLIMIAAAIIGFSIYGNYRNTQPQIIISDDGIQTASAPFIAWQYITGEDVVILNVGKTTGYYLVYNWPNNSGKHSLIYLETNDTELSSLLKTYRERSKGKQG